MSDRPRVVIVGAGFGGLACARRLNRQPVDVILLDRHKYPLFSPLFFQVANGLLNPADIAYPLRTVFRHSPNVRFRQATVAGVDLPGKTVLVRAGPDIPYDYLVLASGSTDNYFGNQEIADVSLGLKVLADATGLRNHVLTCLERADAESNLDVRRALLTFVIVGGGPTGVECSGALAELMQIVAGKDYHQISRSEIRIVLVEGLPRLLNTFSEHRGRYAQPVLERRGGGVRTGLLGWLPCRCVHIDYTIGFRNRLGALGSWAWDYRRHDRPIRIILATGVEPEPAPSVASASARRVD